MFLKLLQRPQILLKPSFKAHPFYSEAFLRLLTSITFGGYDKFDNFVLPNMALTDTTIRTSKPLEKAYKLSDSQGLYLLVQTNGSKLWYLKFRFEGKESRLAFGVYPATSLAQAREMKDRARTLLASGINPSVKKTEEKQAANSNNTFETTAKAWHAANKKWSPSHSSRILRGLEVYLFLHIGKRNIAELKMRDLLAPAKAIERKGKLGAASRLQQRTTTIMRFAVQNGLIDYNPAQDLSGTTATGNKEHRADLPFELIPELLARLDAYQGRKLTRFAVKLTLLVLFVLVNFALPVGLRLILIVLYGLSLLSDHQSKASKCVRRT